MRSSTRRAVTPAIRFHRHRICLEGYALITLIILVGFAAWHSGTNLVYMIFALLIAFFLLHGLIVWMMLRRIEITRELPRHAVALEEVPVTVTLRNKKLFGAAYGLRIGDFFESGAVAGVGFCFRVPARGSTQTNYTLMLPNRGLYKFNRLAVSSRFPFSLVERASFAFRREQLLAYPPIFDVRAVAKELTAEVGERESRRKGPSGEFFGLREYSPAEHGARRIHWRSSIKTGRLMVVEHEREELRRITISLRNSLSKDSEIPSRAPGLQRTQFETAVSMAASLARHFLDENFEVRLVTAQRTTPFATAPEHLHRILKELAVVEPVNTGRTNPARDPEGMVIHVCFADPLPAGGREAGFSPVVDARDWHVGNGAFARIGA